MSCHGQVFARIVERQATNVVRGGFGVLNANAGQAFPALADVLDVVSPPPSNPRCIHTWKQASWFTSLERCFRPGCKQRRGHP